MKILTLLFLVACSPLLGAQDYPSYRLYSIDEFSKIHIADTQHFNSVKNIYFHYPAIARENGIEGVVDVMLLNHSDTSFEILLKTNNRAVFKESIYETISRRRETWLRMDLPFILNFCIDYNMIYTGEKQPDYSSKCTFVVEAHPYNKFGHNENRDSGYIHDANQISYFPQILGGTSFPTKNYNSIEKLLETGIKYCCKKSVHLSHRRPRGLHSEPNSPNYVEPENYIRLVINTKGQISKLELFGKLANKIDRNLLYESMKNIQFLPALSHELKPVNVELEYNVK